MNEFNWYILFYTKEYNIIKAYGVEEQPNILMMQNAINSFMKEEITYQPTDIYIEYVNKTTFNQLNKGK